MTASTTTLPPGLTGPVQVALARAVERIPDEGALPGGSRYELKWDGFRAIVTRDGAGATVWSRRGTDMTTTFTEVAAAAAEQLEPGTVLDGELVVWRAGRLDFESLIARMGRGQRSAAAHAREAPASLAAFDVLAARGSDVRTLPFDERRALLEELAASSRPPLNLSPMTADGGSRHALTPWLVPPVDDHPWPTQVSAAAFGRFNADRTERVELTLVEPIVVEVSADAAWNGQSFRHLLRFVRVRPDTEVGSVKPPAN